MNTRQDILEANDAGNVLETIAATPYPQVESVARTISDLHNLGEIDFLAVFEPPPLAEIPDRSIPSLQRIFCQTLPNIDCSAEAAETACRNMYHRAGNDEAAGYVYGSLSEWFQQNPARADEGLALIHRDPETHRRIVRPVLLVGAIHDAGKYVEEAFNFIERPTLARCAWTPSGHSDKSYLPRASVYSPVQSSASTKSSGLPIPIKTQQQSLKPRQVFSIAPPAAA